MLIEYTPEQTECIKKLDTFINNTDYSQPFVLNGSAGTGKTFLISEYFKSRNLKYLVTTLSGKASSVLLRRGIPSETIHHCLYQPTDLKSWVGYMSKINYALNDCNGLVVKNPKGSHVYNNYCLEYIGDKDIIYYVTKTSKGEEKLHEVNKEEDVPDGYEIHKTRIKNVKQKIIGSNEMFKTWNISDKDNVQQFLILQQIIGFNGEVLDESDGGSWLFKLRTDRLFNMSVLIIDEYGMVPEDMMNQLLKTCEEMKVKLILSGDPNQLSPVNMKPIFFKPNITLNQVMRQSSDNPILQFATLIRLYGVRTAIQQMFSKQSGKFVILKPEQITDSFLKQYKNLNTQVICGKNKTRKWLNMRIKGNDKLEVGDKIIFTEVNDWDYNIDKIQCLTNGTQGIVTSIEKPEDYYYPEYRPEFDDNGERDFENPKLIKKPSRTDLKKDYRLSNYICHVDFESTEGDHFENNRKLINRPVAICRSFDDPNYVDKQYLPRNEIYGKNSNGYGHKVTDEEKLLYSYDSIVEHFEKSGDHLTEPKMINNPIVQKYYRKCYDDYFDCPDYRQVKSVQEVDNDETINIYSYPRTKPYKLNGHIAEHGYACTVHKMQGSESDDVLIWFEPFGDNRDAREQLYTAVTRAKESLVLVMTKEAQEFTGLNLN